MGWSPMNFWLFCSRGGERTTYIGTIRLLKTVRSPNNSKNLSKIITETNKSPAQTFMYALTLEFDWQTISIFSAPLKYLYKRIWNLKQFLRSFSNRFTASLTSSFAFWKICKNRNPVHSSLAPYYVLRNYCLARHGVAGSDFKNYVSGGQ